MPSSADQIRVVIDETSFDFDDLKEGQIDVLLSQFNDVLQDLRSDGLRIGKPPLFANTYCYSQQDLYSFLLSEVDRDVMLRFFNLLDRCPEWDAGFPRCDEVEINGEARQSAWSVCFALTAIISGNGVACLRFPELGRQLGFLRVNSDIGECEVFFFTSAEEIAAFWRSLYKLEAVSEQEFFGSADRAFPNLIFHPDLNFRRFEGSYLELRDLIVMHLGTLNDDFLHEYRTASASGRVSDIESYFGSRGVGGVSRESVRTRRNVGALRMREVEFNGKRVMCEWHTKLRPQVDRIHFAFGDDFADKILIGIFVDHLPT